jgi:hypothetical protein
MKTNQKNVRAGSSVWYERLTCTQEAGGSNPPRSTFLSFPIFLLLLLQNFEGNFQRLEKSIIILLFPSNQLQVRSTTKQSGTNTTYGFPLIVATIPKTKVATILRTNPTWAPATHATTTHTQELENSNVPIHIVQQGYSML